MAHVITLTSVPDDWEDPVLTQQQAQTLLAQPHHVLFAVSLPSAHHHATGGYLLASLMPHAQADILTLYVPPTHRRHGHARRLLQAVLDAARKAACTGLTLEVAASNHAAVRLYTVCGLQQVGLRAGYYHDPVSNLKADALVLALTLA
ncbi:MAG: GNAT family N-acetyltransferase [Alphaproteobacteria bacterium]|nr:MAG: GNAT family N-acetyltransferase [Alphaproteobacteria bacterium]